MIRLLIVVALIALFITGFYNDKESTAVPPGTQVLIEVHQEETGHYAPPVRYSSKEIAGETYVLPQ